MNRSVRPLLIVTLLMLAGLLLADALNRSDFGSTAIATSPAALVAPIARTAALDDVDAAAHVDAPDDVARAGELHGDEPQPGFLANLVTLVLLVLLQAVLGFDNLLYISLESGRAPKDKQKMVRQWGIGLAIFFPHWVVVSLTSTDFSFPK